MSQITISNLDDHILQGLKQIAWQNGLPFDESLRRLLSETVSARAARSQQQRLRSMAGPAFRVPAETE